jgi:hypothetical protein
MSALFALWLCGVCVVGVVGAYYSLPPSGARLDVYEVTLWFLLGTLLAVLAVSATISVVGLVSPLAIQPGWWLP